MQFFVVVDYCVDVVDGGVVVGYCCQFIGQGVVECSGFLCWSCLLVQLLLLEGC